jgi:SAM-dependent methyltransferase
MSVEQTKIPSAEASPEVGDAIRYVLKKARYHRFTLPNGMTTEGEDRSATAAAIFGKDFGGMSMLDIGCHHGFYCIEAKKRGAGRVVGLEGKPKAIKVARRIQEIYGYGDFELVEGFFPRARLPVDRFDVVLLMNVVHHLGTVRRARAMILKAAAMAGKRFILGIRPPASEPGIDAEESKHIYTMTTDEVRIDPETGEQTRDAKALLSRRYVEELLGPLFARVETMDAPDYPGRFIAIGHR